MQLVVPSAVRNAVSAATITFTASSMIRCFFMVRCFSLVDVFGGRRGASPFCAYVINRFDSMTIILSIPTCV